MSEGLLLLTKYLSWVCSHTAPCSQHSEWAFLGQGGGLGPSICGQGPGPGVLRGRARPLARHGGVWRGAESVLWPGGKSMSVGTKPRPTSGVNPRPTIPCLPFRMRLRFSRPQMLCPGSREVGKYLLSELNDKPSPPLAHSSPSVV